MARLAMAAFLPLVAVAADGDVAKDYAERIRPLIAKACGDCHGTTPKKNDLDLTSLGTAQAMLAKPRLLEDIAERVREGDMPPRKAPQPSAGERERLLGWISAAMAAEAAARAGDPGPVALRRLSNAEYDNAVRDLTGVDMRPTREFPPDGVGGEGFANVGEAMPMTPGLIERYHQAAREVAARAVLLPSGFRFSPSGDRPVWTDEAIKALRAFHARHAGPKGEPPLEAHVVATIKHRARLAGRPAAIAEVAAAEKLNPIYLRALWEGLNGTAPSPMLDVVRAAWRAATTDPAPVLAAIRAGQGQLWWENYGNKDRVLTVGNGYPAWYEAQRVVAQERVSGIAREPFFRLVARQVDPAAPGTCVVWDRLRLEGSDAPTLVLAEHPELRAAIEQAAGLRFGQHPKGRTAPQGALVTEASSVLAIDLRKLPPPLAQALALPRFLRADVSLDAGGPESATVQAWLMAEPKAKAPPPDKLALAKPEPRTAQIAHPRVAAERARPAAEFRALFPPRVLFEPIIPRDAQGSLFMFHREDEPLRRLMLDEAGRAELDRLWSELRFVSQDALVNPLSYPPAVIFYRAENRAFDIQFNAERLEREEKSFRAELVAAEPRQLEALIAFAPKVWRRPLRAGEREAILAAYQRDRSDGVEHDPAFRAALARVLASPWFLYRVERPSSGPRWQPVSGHELATRLSFLVWASTPDDELRGAAPRLHEPAVLEAQLRRMLKDGRVRGMAEEFGARWLGVRDFAANHGRSLEDFPEFTPALRDALAEEPVRFLQDLLVDDRPVADLVAADAVVVNEILARHYGIPGVSGADWRRVEGVAAYGRGGLLGFGAVLAKQSAAARTSPIKRGAWLAHLLGERLPKPPDDVPPLPEGEPKDLTVREITERHSRDPLCAGCHARIDPYGMTLERFDAIGRLRPAGGPKPIDARATLPDGSAVDDIAGLRAYLAGKRRDDVLRTMARKLVGYALGRAVMLSDRALVDDLARTMAAGGRWSDALLVVVRSEQFRCIRPAPSAPSAAPAQRP